MPGTSRPATDRIEIEPRGGESSRSQKLLFDLARGAVAGAIATVPMTAVITAMNRTVPPNERRPLPPRQITEELAERSDARQRTDEVGLDAATMTAHFAFGAATGALYGVAYRTVANRFAPSPYLAGTLFGLGVWTVSYAGALPALELQRRPDERPRWRNTTMIAGHIVWGAVLGWAEKRMRG